MKKALSLLLALVMCLSLCACGGVKKNPIVGTWKGGTQSGTYTYIFNTDGTYSLQITGLFALDDHGTYSYDEESNVLTFNSEEDGTSSTTIELNECYLCIEQVNYGKVYSNNDDCTVLNTVLGNWKQALPSGEYIDNGGTIEFKKDGTYTLTTSTDSASGIYIYNPATKIVELPVDGITLKMSEDTTKLIGQPPSICFKR